MRKTKKSKILSLMLCMSMILSTFTFMPGLAYAEPTDETVTEQTTPEPEPTTEKSVEPAADDAVKPANDAQDSKAKNETDSEKQPSSAEKPADEQEPSFKTVDFTNVAPFLAPVNGKSSVAHKAKSALAKAAGAMVTAAEGNNGSETSRVDNDGVVTTKTATPNEDGSYKIRLESYVTGATTTTTVTEDVPTDIVLVLDQSGSMADEFTSGSYEKVYKVDQSKAYYVEGWLGYNKVTWCKTCKAWTRGCSWGHDYSTKYTPKTSETSKGTQFYEDHEAITKLQALQDAANSFVDEVAKKAKGNDGKTVDHRIAVVGYASSASNLTKGFQDMSTDSGKNTVTSVIDKLSANGGTMINQGIDTANSIFETNPIPTNEKRNRVMIVFTDGAPGLYGNWASASVGTANDAIKAAKTSKETYKATVYSVGIFEGADASQPSSLPEYTAPGRNESSPSSENQIKNSNRFMHLISSNYPNASDINTPGTINANLNGKSYYLSASNSAALNDIFQQISSQIESGGASVKLDSSTVVRDIVSDYFQLPEGTQASDITLKTADFDGYESDNKTAKWKKESPATGVTAAIKDRTVKVTGFDFAANYVGIDKNNGTETARGKKLIIEFNVKARDGFLGGNAVPTNGKDSGIYTTKDGGETVVENFEQPTVDIPIKDITATAADQNVYLKGNADIGEIKKNTVVSAGNITLNLSEDNYGLKAWQNAYVDLTVSAKDSSGKDIFTSDYSGMSNLKDDMSYTVNAEIKAKGAASGKTASATGKINVFKPELKYNDSTVYYGDTAPTSYDGNKVGGTVWKHGGTASTDEGVIMTGVAPGLDISYSPYINNEAYYKGGKISTKQDIPVKATVKIGDTDVTEHATFKHDTCSESGCSFKQANEQFLIHVKTCSLTVTKTGGEDGEPYVMNIYKDDKLYTSMTIVGNNSATVKELPVGAYTVQEDTDWAWRYKDPAPAVSAGVTLSDKNDTGTITVNNRNRYNSFLNGYSTVVKNVFGDII